MFSIEELERALSESNRQWAALRAKGYSDRVVGRVFTQDISSIVTSFPVVAYVGSELVYNFDVADRYRDSLSICQPVPRVKNG